MASIEKNLAPKSVTELGKIRSIISESVIWVDIIDPTQTEIAKLAKDYRFHPLNLEDSISTRQTTKVEEHEEYLFIALRFPVEDSLGIISSNQVSMFLGKNYLVTLHPNKLRVLSELFQTCNGDAQGKKALMKSTAYLVYRIIDKLTESMFRILDDVQSGLDDIETKVFDEKKSSASAINRVRRQIAILRQIIFPLRLFVPEITSKAQKYSEDGLSVFFSDINHKIGRASGTVEEMKEIVEIYKDTDFIISSDRTNSVLSILTILFTLSIPATLISSIYGMNVPLPGGLVTGPLNFFGPYTSLLVLLIGMLIPAVIMVWYFRRVGWFNA
ncbi:MAG: magnesium transporter CorA family protein [Nitrososphaerota archaeon]|nr:magnesium transporter CorA family protein [Nitrososphaerota archaeon]